MTILGVALYAALNAVAWYVLQASFAGAIQARAGYYTTLIPEAYTWAYVAAASFYLIFDVAALIYVLCFYFSYFSPKPRATGSRAISFLNGFFGTLPFAPLWNTCLTKRKRGVSWGFAIFFYLADGVLFGYLLARFLLDFVF